MGSQMKKTKIILILIFLIYPFFSYSHVNHYDKLKIIQMDVLRNGKKIGYNKYSFKNQNNLFIVNNEINFAAKLMGIKFSRSVPISFFSFLSIGIVHYFI